MQVLDTPESTKKSKVDGMNCLVKESLTEDGLVLKSNVLLPPIAPDEVRIKVLQTAVCGTDKSIWKSSTSDGIRKEMMRYVSEKEEYKPIIVGHEFCGIIDELGSGITNERFSDLPEELRVSAGDYVTCEMHLACGHCYQCRTGSEHICTRVKVKGVHMDGCFAEYVTVPYKNVILLGKDGDTSKIPPKIASMLDAFGNAVHTVSEADVRGKSVAILGAGPLGLMAAFLCRDFGAARIYLTEAADVDRRFTIGEEFGADFCFDVSKGSKDFYKAVEKNEAMSNGVDVVIEMSGSPLAYNDAFQIVRNGGTVLLLGITRKPLDNFDLANGVIWKGVTVKGIFGRKMYDTWETMLGLLSNPRLNMATKLDKVLASKIYNLTEYENAFEKLTSGEEMKLVFKP